MRKCPNDWLADPVADIGALLMLHRLVTVKSEIHGSRTILMNYSDEEKRHNVFIDFYSHVNLHLSKIP